MTDNSVIQIINSEKAVGTIISKFSIDFIMGIIEDNLRVKFRPFNVGAPNFVIVIEQQLQQTILMNPSYKDQIDETRERTYKDIIRLICKAYNLEIAPEVEEYMADQAYNLAVILFDVFITNFTPRMINFFVRYILNNKTDIYNSIPDKDGLKRDRELTSYGRKLYTDHELIVIHSDLNSVLNGIAAHDIPLPVLLNYLVDKPTADYLSSILIDTGDIYKYHYASYILDNNTRADLFTAIKFDMQNRASDKPIDFTQYAV